MYQFAKKKSDKNDLTNYSQELVYLQYDPLFGRAFDVICSDLFMSLIMSSARGGPKSACLLRELHKQNSRLDLYYTQKKT
jgi:hypothetical protein